MQYIKYQTIDKKIHTKKYGDDAKDVDLDGERIMRILEIKGMENILTLNLSNNQIEQIEGLGDLGSLQELSLGNNRIQRIEGLGNLRSLQQLWLNNNQIQRIEGLGDIRSLQTLDLGNNRIQRIEKLKNLQSLKTLYLHNNQIKSIKKLKNLQSLQELCLHNNQIQRIEGLGDLRSLQTLYLDNNQLQRIEGLGDLRSLQTLSLDNNRIRLIEGLGDLGSLQELWLGNNQIQRIEGLGDLRSLQNLSLNGNQIRLIEGLGDLRSLQKLYLIGNQIRLIEGLGDLISLQQLHLHNNPLGDIPISSIICLKQLQILRVDVQLNPIIERFLARNSLKESKTIYSDSQNVHNNQINQSISDSLFRLLDVKVTLSDETIMEEILADPILEGTVKQAIVEYSKIPDIHSKLNVTFFEALKVVWQIVRKHKDSQEIKRIMNQEMKDSLCRCFTGRLSRLVNCLNGFDPRVSVKISDSHEISNLIIAIRGKTDKLSDQIKLVGEEMRSRGHGEEMIREWLGYME